MPTVMRAPSGATHGTMGTDRRRREVFVGNQTAATLAAALIMLAGCSPASTPTGPAKPTTAATSAPAAVAPTQAPPVAAPASPPAPLVPTTAPAAPSAAVAVAPSPVAPTPAAAAPSPAAPISVAAAPAPGDGRTHPGPYFLGRANAPVTLDEYADFQ